jgi:hypothetical protein
MSLTPDTFYRGPATCRVCDKQMHVNDVGVTYHTYGKGKDDLLFCAPCAMKVVASVAQDVCRVEGHHINHSFAYYEKFKDAQSSLRRHAAAFDKLADQMRLHAESLDYARGVTPVKE